MPASANLTLDIGSLRRRMLLGFRRASAFLQIGLNDLENRHPESLNFQGGIAFHVWPDPVPAEALGSAKDEFRIWLAAATLKELDAFFCDFLDRAAWLAEVGQYHGKTISSSHVFRSPAHRQPNSAQKFRAFRDIVSGTDYFYQINSIRLARNCMTHNFGLVRTQDCNNETRTQLEVSWLVGEVVVERGGAAVPLSDTPISVQDLPGEGSAAVGFRLVEANKVFKNNEKLIFSDIEVGQICFFYYIVSEQLVNRLVEYLRQFGLDNAQFNSEADK